MNGEAAFGMVLCGIGIFMIIGAIKRPKWFMDLYSVEKTFSAWGSGAVALYCIQGLIFIIGGVAAIWQSR